MSRIIMMQFDSADLDIWQTSKLILILLDIHIIYWISFVNLTKFTV